MYLSDQHDLVVHAIKEAFEDVAEAQLGFPDLVVAQVWSFAKPNLWTPE